MVKVYIAIQLHFSHCMDSFLNKLGETVPNRAQAKRFVYLLRQVIEYIRALIGPFLEQGIKHFKIK